MTHSILGFEYNPVADLAKRMGVNPNASPRCHPEREITECRHTVDHDRGYQITYWKNNAEGHKVACGCYDESAKEARLEIWQPQVGWHHMQTFQLPRDKYLLDNWLRGLDRVHERGKDRARLDIRKALGLTT